MLRLLSFMLLFLTGCLGESVPDGRILVKNDSQDREYNVITVNAGGAVHSLKPGEHAILPSRTTRFSVSRRYKDFTRSYSVSCPVLTGGGITIKMIDIHVNRMPGGCRTTSGARE